MVRLMNPRADFHPAHETEQSGTSGLHPLQISASTHPENSAVRAGEESTKAAGHGSQPAKSTAELSGALEVVRWGRAEPATRSHSARIGLTGQRSISNGVCGSVGQDRLVAASRVVS
jgi:hypothetical protein